VVVVVIWWYCVIVIVIGWFLLWLVGYTCADFSVQFSLCLKKKYKVLTEVTCMEMEIT